MAGDNSVKVEIKDVIKRFQTRNGAERREPFDQR